MTTDHHFHFDQPGETWRQTDVDGYYVSDLGRLASARRRGPGDNIDMAHIALRVLSPGSGGYVRFGLAGESRYIHRLVAAAFLPVPPTGASDVEFLDDDFSNCRADNLAWKAPADRNPAPHASGKKLDEAVVRSLRQDLANGLRVVRASEKYGVSKVTIHAIKAGRTWGHVV